MLEALNLSLEQVLVLGILLFNLILSVSAVVRTDVVAVLVLVLLGLTNILPHEKLFSGFSSEAVISLIAIMVVGAGLDKSGIAIRLARFILKICRERPSYIVNMLMLIAGLLASFMRNVGSVALLLPVVSRISIRSGISKSALLMPIAFSAVLGGTLTLVGSSPLIMVNSLIKDLSTKPLAPFKLLEVFPVGLMLLVAGWLYLVLIGKKLLPVSHQLVISHGTAKGYFLKTYGKGGDIFELKILPGSPFLNATLRDLEMKLDPTMAIIALLQGQDFHFPPLRKMVIEDNARIALMGTLDTVELFAHTYGLKLFKRLHVFSDTLHLSRAGLCEAVVPPSSHLIGHDVGELHMKRTHQINVLALYRDNKVYRGEELKNITLRSGDTLGMFSRWDALAAFHKNPDFVVVTSAYPREEMRPKKLPFAILFSFFPVVLVLMGISLPIALLLGAVGMIASGVLSVDEAYASVSWQNVFLIAGFMPLGIAMQHTGSIDLITYYIHPEYFSPLLIQVGLAVMVTVFALFISNIGATVIFVPIAFELARKLGVDPRLYILTVALAASNNFLLPTNQVNTLIAGPGNYKTWDFIKVGAGMTVIYLMVMILGLKSIF